MLWLKAFHIVFMVTWFAGLFYLPRLFVYHATTVDQTSHERFCVMERRLLAIMTIGAVLTAVFGIWLLLLLPGLLATGWVQLKLVLVALLIAYHIYCGVIVGSFRERKNQHSETWFRWFNEAPSLMLIAIVVLAIVKPF
ncbi:MAG: CopD family protein [Gammaproteobacteria bacterium]|nr:CopD family protein [Gammaproteobacteria bacterium]